MKKNIVILLFLTSLCLAQPYQRQRVYFKEKIADPGKTMLNQFCRDLEEHFSYASRRMGTLRRTIKWTGTRKANREFKDILQTICNDVKDTMNGTLPRIDEGLLEIQ